MQVSKMCPGSHVIFWIFTTFFHLCSSYECGSLLIFEPSVEPVLFPSQRMIVKNVVQCETACRRDSTCISLNYDFKTGFCDLNTYDHGYEAASSGVKDLLQKNCEVHGVDPCADCLPGYRCVYAANEYMCLYGRASSPLSVVDCGPVPEVQNTLMSYNSTLYGSTVTITCANNTVLYEGTNIAVCDERGQWIGVPVCKKNFQSIDGWVLLLRATADVNISVYDVWMNDTIYHDHPVENENLQPGCMTLDTSLPCDMHFKSKLVTVWESAYIGQIKVVVLKENTVKAEIVFDGVGTTKTSWFTPNRIFSSTWTDIKTSTHNIFRLKGQGHINRRFQINSYFSNCPGDVGWLVVVDKLQNNACFWEKAASKPNILYSAGLNASVCAEFESGDVMAILAKQENST